MAVRNVYLKIEAAHDYSPVRPDSYGAEGVDWMRNAGHADGIIPPTEARARRLDALIYQEYLDHHWLVPKPDKIVWADVNEPPFLHRVPGTVIYAKPGDRLRIHIKNADTAPHSFHLHGLSHGIDSDGVWPFGTQSRDGRRSDEICPGQSWRYTFDVHDDVLGAWPFHDHYRDFTRSVERGLFGGLVVLPAKDFEALPRFPLPQRLVELLEELEHHGSSAASLTMSGDHAGVHRLPTELRDQVLLLEEHMHTPQRHLIPKPPLPLHVPIFLHSMSDDGGAQDCDGLPSRCINGRCFIGNTPTILAASGQKIVWCVFNLDFEASGHGFHAHGQRWRFAGETGGGRALAPGQSFVAETTGPPALLLPPEIEKYQDAGHRPRDAKPFRLRGDFLFHGGEASLREGLAGLVRATQTVWLKPEDAAKLEAQTGLPLDLGDDESPAIDLDRSASAVAGRWVEIPCISKVSPMHMVLLPDSRRVLFWGYGPRPDRTRIWDLDTKTYSQPSPQTHEFVKDENIWSGAHAYLSDGTILAHGGFKVEEEAAFTDDTERRSLFFDPWSLGWSKGPDMNVRRYYSTTITLADGRLLTLFGQNTTSGLMAKSLEIFDPGPPAVWKDLRNFPLSFGYDFYPWTFLLPNGDLFIAGPRQPSRRFDWTDDPIQDKPENQWTFTIKDNDGNPIDRGDNMDGTAVLLPLDPPRYEPRVLVAGGELKEAQKTVEWIDLSAAKPGWKRLRDMNFDRDHLTSILLPDGRVFVIGGIPQRRTDPPDLKDSVELFDPENPEAGWQLGPAMQTKPRRYHSAAILLADGSVFVGGDTAPGPIASRDGGNLLNERYLPSYFFKPRPEITSAPERIRYGAAFTVKTPRARQIRKVVLIRPGAVTHGFDMSQRVVGCDFRIPGAADLLKVEAPPHGNIAPPGYYLLFLVNHDRVPSTGVWILVEK